MASSRLTDGHLHTCDVEEQRSGGKGVGGRTYRAEITPRRRPAVTFHRCCYRRGFYPLICEPEGGRKLGPDGEEVEFALLES